MGYVFEVDTKTLQELRYCTRGVKSETCSLSTTLTFQQVIPQLEALPVVFEFETTYIAGPLSL
jgi:hypothetical protein